MGGGGLSGFFCWLRLKKYSVWVRKEESWHWKSRCHNELSLFVLQSSLITPVERRRFGSTLAPGSKMDSEEIPSCETMVTSVVPCCWYRPPQLLAWWHTLVQQMLFETSWQLLRKYVPKCCVPVSGQERMCLSCTPLGKFLLEAFLSRSP